MNYVSQISWAIYNTLGGTEDYAYKVRQMPGLREYRCYLRKKSEWKKEFVLTDEELNAAESVEQLVGNLINELKGSEAYEFEMWGYDKSSNPQFLGMLDMSADSYASAKENAIQEAVDKHPGFARYVANPTKMIKDELKGSE